MRFALVVLLALFSAAVLVEAQTADELVNKNIQAKGGIEKMKAIKSTRVTGRFSGGGGFSAVIGQENLRPNLVRNTFSLQGMTSIQAYDGTTGWQIQPFGGRKDPELIGEDNLRSLVRDADFDGPLVDYKEKGNTVEYLGHDIVDGDDALRLKVTLKNGDFIYFFLDPDTFLEIRKETVEFVRGSVRDSLTDLGSYKPVAGVMYPFTIATGPKDNPNAWQTVTLQKIEVNVSIDNADFAVPAALKQAAAKQPEAGKK